MARGLRDEARGVMARGGDPLEARPSMSLARNISAYWARPIPRSQPSMSKFSLRGSCQQLILKRVESSAPAVIARGFSNQPWIRHVDADYSTAAYPPRQPIPDRSDRRRMARDRTALAEALRDGPAAGVADARD